MACRAARVLLSTPHCRDARRRSDPQPASPRYLTDLHWRRLFFRPHGIGLCLLSHRTKRTHPIPAGPGYTHHTARLRDDPRRAARGARNYRVLWTLRISNIEPEPEAESLSGQTLGENRCRPLDALPKPRASIPAKSTNFRCQTGFTGIASNIRHAGG